MKIGFDVDGVLAAFNNAYKRIIERESGRRLIDVLPDEESGGPHTWFWERAAGYTKEEEAAAWAVIRWMPDFWFKLPPLSGAEVLATCIFDMEQNHDIYFITSRSATPGAKRQTEEWLRQYLGMSNPTVLISSSKGLCVAGLKLDAYIDDNLDNVTDVAAHTELRNLKTQIFLLDKNYNKANSLPTRVTRVRSVGQMLDYLVLDNL